MPQLPDPTSVSAERAKSPEEAARLQTQADAFARSLVSELNQRIADKPFQTSWQAEMSSETALDKAALVQAGRMVVNHFASSGEYTARSDFQPPCNALEAFVLESSGKLVVTVAGAEPMTLGPAPDAGPKGDRIRQRED